MSQPDQRYQVWSGGLAKAEPVADAMPAAPQAHLDKMSARPYAVASINMPGLHFHDLRHTGNRFAAQSGAGLQDLMARMGHDSERATMIYQNQARDTDQFITNAINDHVRGEQRKDGKDGATAILAG
jgi:integrase